MLIGSTRRLGVLAVLAASGCGDPVVGLDYQGDPMATLSGQVLLGKATVTASRLFVIIGWGKQTTAKRDWIAKMVDVSGGFPASYMLHLLKPAPREALNTDPETGGQLGFSFIALMEDVNGNGELDVDQTTVGLPAGPDRFRGGPETLLLAYAADPFPADCKIGRALGQLGVGYHLMQADERFRCIWKDSIRDWSCPSPRTELRQVPFSTPVDLKVFEQPSEWSPVHSPDWLFLP